MDYLPTSRRVRMLRISSEMLKTLFGPGKHSVYTVVEDALPTDALLINVRYGWPYNVDLLFESPEFPEVPEGAEIPELIPTIVADHNEN